MKNNTSHPAFILGILSYFLLIVGVGLKANSFRAGYYVLAAVPILGAVHWVWSLYTVIRDPQLKGTESRVLWLLVVIIIAPLGGMMYFFMRRKRVSF